MRGPISPAAWRMEGKADSRFPSGYSNDLESEYLNPLRGPYLLLEGWRVSHSPLSSGYSNDLGIEIASNPMRPISHLEGMENWPSSRFPYWVQ
ncbi:hypothetical protein AVEN_218570-1 [Araneus ventricosus]|uniref:Uncharacterized protein n=1 Tax=Araneus ventricosus TaxID=182803 RepID=A0A4Y2R663_ARAVE|nr:hypothetical protein AVEN_218570-1 [Araneus ventricosus]